VPNNDTEYRLEQIAALRYDTRQMEDSSNSKYDRNAAQFPQWVGFLMLLAAQMSCSRGVSKPSVPSLELRSSSFTADAIPSKYQGSPENCPCNGKDISPELSWNSSPQRTQSFALIVTDKDSPLWFNFVHWVVYDLPSDKRELPEGIAKQGELPDGSRQGQNGFDKIGYAGPCPPGHSPHRYVFGLYALNTRLNLPPGASKKQVVKAMKGHVLASGELVGKYQR
jgi:Raf kinase inhibitor-like YbhB/YbcL family protein